MLGAQRGPQALRPSGWPPIPRGFGTPRVQGFCPLRPPGFRSSWERPVGSASVRAPPTSLDHGDPAVGSPRPPGLGPGVHPPTSTQATLVWEACCWLSVWVPPPQTPRATGPLGSRGWLPTSTRAALVRGACCRFDVRLGGPPPSLALAGFPPHLPRSRLRVDAGPLGRAGPLLGSQSISVPQGRQLPSLTVNRPGGKVRAWEAQSGVAGPYSLPSPLAAGIPVWPPALQRQ